MPSNPKRISKQTCPPVLAGRRIFIDSSVLIAAAISATGSARDLIIESLHTKIQIVISDMVIEETQRNLTHKAPQALTALQEFLEALNPKVVSPTKKKILKAAKIVDIKDAPIIAGAITAKANYLVSFDRKHILRQRKQIKESFKIQVATPDELT